MPSGAWRHKVPKLELGNQWNPKHREIVPNRTLGIFLGYRISRAGISPGRKLRRRMKGRLRLAASKGKESLVCSIHSYRGLLLFPHGG